MNILRGNNELRYPDDCRRIKKVLLDNGYDATLMECQVVWELYSDSMAAGWMGLPETDQEIFDCISGYIE